MGNHLILEVYDVKFDLLNTLEPLVEVMTKGINRANMTILNTFTYKFTPQGVTILFALAESHVSLHSFPEEGCLSFDAYTCGAANPKIIVIELLKYLNSENYKLRHLYR
ncbi:MAG: adenosylmethionine decarboxylase [Candidatus Lokiarchaeota archaeon]|nr:adenosylmethionine decarboxylase [Candidatus Lokiarchaeota archaeon]